MKEKLPLDFAINGMSEFARNEENSNAALHLSGLHLPDYIFIQISFIFSCRKDIPSNHEYVYPYSLYRCS